MKSVIRIILLVVVVLVVIFALATCVNRSSGAGDAAGSRPEQDQGAPASPGSLSVDDEEGGAGQGQPSAADSALPAGIAGAEPGLIPANWIKTSPFQTCPDQELTLNGISYLADGLMMVSFVDPYQAYQIPPSLVLPAFLNTYAEDGTLTAEYDCTKHPEAPGLIYCFGKSLPAGYLAQARLAFGERVSTAIYDLPEAGTPEEGESVDKFLAGYSDLDGSLIFPEYFGYNRDYLEGIWGTEGTALDGALDFSVANQAASSLGFTGEIKTMIGVFNALSACQIMAKLGGPLPEGCQELGSSYYQPRSDCGFFPDCYQSCSEDLGFVSSEGEHDLGMKELLDYVKEELAGPIPATCSDYLYFSQSVLFYGSSDGDGEGDGSDFLDSITSSNLMACMLNPGSFFCSDEDENEESDQEVQTIPAELASSVLSAGCMLDYGNPLCTGDFPGSGSEDEVPVLNLCAGEISWADGIDTYGDASSLLAYLLSIAPSLKPGSLPDTCQQALAETGAAFTGTGLGGVLSSLIYSGSVSSCIYQASFVVPADDSAGGSGGGAPGSGSSKPSCGPGLIPVLWQGNWICIPEN